MERIVRVNQLLKREVGLVLERTSARDLNCLVSVTDVQVSNDLRHANVMISVYGTDEQKSQAMALLHARRRDIQRDTMKNIKLKYTPVMHFKLDNTLEKADEVFRILDALEESGQISPPEEDEPEGDDAP